MGIAQAGIAFKPIKPILDISALVSELCGEKANSIEHPDVGQFDIRNHSDVMVQIFGESYFICNHDIVWNLLEKPQTDITKIHNILGRPELFIVFCRYDSGGSYGYAFVEYGHITRSRLQTIACPQLPPLIELGSQKEIEKRWLSAEFFLEEDDCPIDEWQKIYYQGEREIMVPEHDLTCQILHEILINEFSVCPWDTDIEPNYHFFRLAAKDKP